MNILVLLKRVPDTAARVRVGEDHRDIDPSGIEFVMSPYDEIALERALQLKEESGGRVTALTLGPAASEKELRTALAMGADAAVHLVDEAEWRDAAATAAAIAPVIEEGEYDLVMAGLKAVDTDDGAVPHFLAARLSLPCLTAASNVDVADGRVTVRREIDGVEQVLEASLPAVVTAQKGLAEPRFASLKGVMMAKKKKVDRRDAAAADPRLRRVRMDEPPPRPKGRIVGEGTEAVPELVDALVGERKLF